MREVKYRAYDKHHRHGVIGNVVMINFSSDECIVGFGDPDQDDNTEGWGGYASYGYALSEVVLLQFTGHKDCKGVDIYEGDIVEIKNMYSATWNTSVSWGTVRPMYTWMTGETWLIGNTGPLYPYCEMRNGYDVTVIGNIYEHPELLAERNKA